MTKEIQELVLLLVEDSADDVFFFERALKKSGIPARLQVAEDGAHAIDYCQRAAAGMDPQRYPRPDLMLLDLKMPNVSGLEVLEWLSQQSFTPPLKVVVLTSSEEPSDIQRSRELGARGYLTKPLEPAQVRALLDGSLPLTFPAPLYIPPARTLSWLAEGTPP